MSNWKTGFLSDMVTDPITYGIVQPGDFRKDGIPLIRGKDYMQGWAGEKDLFRVDPDLHEKYKRSKVAKGDVLLSIAGYVGETAIVPEWIEEANITQTSARIRCDEAILYSKYLFYFLQSNEGREITKKFSKGSAQSGLNLSDIGRFEVPVPPLPEQKKIADILSGIDQTIEKQYRRLEKVNLAGQAKLLHEISRLESEENDVDKLLIGEVCEKIFVGIASSTTHAYTNSTGVPMLRNQNIKSGRIDATDLVYIKKDFALEHGKKKLVAGDVITARTGYPGESAVVGKEFENCHSFTTLISRLRKQIVLPEYFALYLNSPAGKRQVAQMQAGGAQENLNVSALEKMVIPVPSLSEQKRIVEISTAFLRIDNSLQATIRQLQQLKKGISSDLLSGRKRVSV